MARWMVRSMKRSAYAEVCAVQISRTERLLVAEEGIAYLKAAPVLGQ